MGKINGGWKKNTAGLTYGVYSPASVEREVGTSWPESPAGSGRYIAFSTTVQDGDDVIISDAVGIAILFGEYLKEGMTWAKNG